MPDEAREPLLLDQNGQRITNVGRRKPWFTMFIGLAVVVGTAVAITVPLTRGNSKGQTDARTSDFVEDPETIFNSLFKWSDSEDPDGKKPWPIDPDGEDDVVNKDDKKAFDYDNYNTYDDIMLEVEAMAGRCDPAITCTFGNLGSSYEAREIPTLMISSGSDNPMYWIDATIHPREWLAPATLLKLMDHFTRNYGNDSDVTALIDNYDWYFLPMLNPDGYIWSWTDDRDWRKNRTPNDGSSCIGTDINRNFDTHWMNDGTSADPCDETYGGSGAASEPETLLLQAEVTRLAPTIQGLLSIHAGGQVWLHPYGNTLDDVCARTPDHDELARVVTSAADASQATYNTTFARGSTCEVLNPASGGIVDYAYDSGPVLYSISPELRGGGWVVDPTNIDPTFHEFYNGLRALVAAIQG